MKLLKHRPSPALVVATLALFVALGGAGIAATGDNFILGQANSADSTTKLVVSTLPAAATCPAPCQALQVTDNSIAANAGGLGVLNKSPSTPAATLQNTNHYPALRLLVSTGTAPFTVNSTTKVTNLNADRLDGIDSTGFLKNQVPLTLTGTTASNGIITGKAVGGANGVQGVTDVNWASGVYGENNGGGAGVAGRSNQPGGTGVYGEATGAGGLAGKFEGDVSVSGQLTVGGAKVATGGKLLRDAAALSPNNAGWFAVFQDPGYFTVGYRCPDPATDNGIIVFRNDSSEAMNLFIDNGSSNPEYVLLAAGDRRDRPAAAGGEWYTYQFHSSKGITQVSVFSVHRTATPDCHIQAQAIETP